MSSDPWDPAQYERFRAERNAPFLDLLGWIRARPGMRALDLGCGTGELTVALAERLGGAHVDGVDSSAAMLAKAAPRRNAWVSFRLQDIAEITNFTDYDLIFSHAALHWVPHHERLIPRMLDGLKPGGQIAVQIPANHAHPSHRIAHELAAEPPFRALLGGFVAGGEALPLERYAELLWAHGLREQACIEKIYGHELAASAEVVEWVKGTLLAAYLARLEPPLRDAFLAAYRERLLAVIGERAPYFYSFRRLLFWGRKPDGRAVEQSIPGR